MEYGYIMVPVAPVRRKAKHQAELTNQFLFGEPVKVLRSKGKGWLKVRSLQDQHEGWLTSNLLQEAEEFEVKQYSTAMTGEMFTRIMLGGSAMLIPFGSTLPLVRDGAGRLGELPYTIEPPVSQRSSPADPAAVGTLVSPWLNAPYLWGGKTIFGVDCSGFVQVIYKALGYDLPRDAWQQAQEGSTVEKFRDAAPGDLLFFDDHDEIVHVGIYLGSERIVHASGKVRIDRVDKKGITHMESGKRTHTLRVIKRLSRTAGVEG